MRRGSSIAREVRRLSQGKPPVERGDDRWTITRPPLPNWVGSPPPLLWVRRDVLSESAPAVRVACGSVYGGGRAAGPLFPA